MTSHTRMWVPSSLTSWLMTWSMVEPGEREARVWALVSVREPGTRLMRWVAVCRSALASILGLGARI